MPPRSNSPATELRLAQLCQLTDLSPQVIRAWERRYGFPEPTRSEGGQRRYSRGQAAQLQRAAVLVRGGFRPREAIGRAQQEAAGQAPWPPPPDHDQTVVKLAGMLIAGSPVEALAWLRGIEAAMGFEHVLEELVLPALREVGARWATGEMTVAEEHAATGIVVSWLGVVRSESPAPVVAEPAVMIACPPGEAHSVAVFALEALLLRRGISALALGGDLPAADLAAQVASKRPRAVVLSLAQARNRPALEEVVSALRSMPAAPSLYAGGPGLGRHLPDGVKALPGSLVKAAEQLRSEIPTQTLP